MCGICDMVEIIIPRDNRLFVDIRHQMVYTGEKMVISPSLIVGSETVNLWDIKDKTTINGVIVKLKSNSQYIQSGYENSVELILQKILEKNSDKPTNELAKLISSELSWHTEIFLKVIFEHLRANGVPWLLYRINEVLDQLSVQLQERSVGDDELNKLKELSVVLKFIAVKESYEIGNHRRY